MKALQSAGGTAAGTAQRLSFGFLVLLLGLALAEGLVRALGLAPDIARIEIDKPYGQFVSSDNRVLRYVPKPSSGDVNDYGIRDHDYAIRKPAGTFRIIVIGDSIGYGFCTDDEVLAVDDVFPKVLERSLNRQSKDRRVEVINLSVSGYDTAQEVEFLVAKGLALSPDIVIVAYCLNDALVASAELMDFERHPGFRLREAVAQRLFLESHLARLVWLAYLSRASDRSPDGHEKVDSAFDRLRGLSETHGFDTLVVIFPVFIEDQSGRWKSEHLVTRRSAEERAFSVLDLLPDLEPSAPGNVRRFQGRCNRQHPNERGHELAARAIESYLIERGLWRAQTEGAQAGTGQRPPVLSE